MLRSANLNWLQTTISNRSPWGTLLKLVFKILSYDVWTRVFLHWLCITNSKWPSIPPYSIFPNNVVSQEIVCRLKTILFRKVGRFSKECLFRSIKRWKWPNTFDRDGSMCNNPCSSGNNNMLNSDLIKLFCQLTDCIDTFFLLQHFRGNSSWKKKIKINVYLFLTWKHFNTQFAVN